MRRTVTRTRGRKRRRNEKNTKTQSKQPSTQASKQASKQAGRQASICKCHAGSSESGSTSACRVASIHIGYNTPHVSPDPLHGQPSLVPEQNPRPKTLKPKGRRSTTKPLCLRRVKQPSGLCPHISSRASCLKI